MIYGCFPLGGAEKAPPPQIGLSVGDGAGLIGIPEGAGARVFLPPCHRISKFNVLLVLRYLIDTVDTDTLFSSQHIIKNLPHSLTYTHCRFCL